jgi:hypothetical protein
MSEQEIKNLISSLTRICSLYQQVIWDMASILEVVIESAPEEQLKTALTDCRELTVERLMIVQQLVNEAHAVALEKFGIHLKFPETIH